MYLLLSFLFLGWVGINQVLVNSVDESSGSVLSLLVFLLLVSSLSLEETSLCLKSQFSSLSVVGIGLLVHSSDGGKVGVKSFQSIKVL